MDHLVSQHYSRENLYEKIIDSLPDDLLLSGGVTREHIAGVDEFHVRGLKATAEIAAAANLQPGTKVLDVGCGIGGPARLLADEYGCQVTGIDLSKEFIRTARLLTKLIGLQDRADFQQASALLLPFDDQTFDVVWTQHVQMNIPDKLDFYGEIFRVLKNGGSFIYYDIFSGEKGPIHFPVPWADNQTISHLFPVKKLHQILVDLGFDIINTKDQTQSGTEFFRQTARRIREKGLPPISIHLLMGHSAPIKLANLLSNLEEGRVVLESGICQKM